ncbi:MAG: Gfo/Idh/MocA family oxidoreductase [Geminicoccaceae bacterium]|nr:Gfo/Idh/MocA family oxidoreductase [Geminicoccaceae bacterium]
MTQKWGLIGFGRFGKLHAESIARAPGAELATIAVASERSAMEAKAAYPHAEITTDWHRLVATPDLDVVDVVSPNARHAEMAIAALENGHHVLVEKPLATTLSDCDRLVETVDRTGKLLSVGFELRLSVQWRRIKSLIDEGRIGRPRFVNVTLFRHPYRSGAGGWRHDSSAVGSWILEEPVHFYDLAMWYLESLGDPLSVNARGTLNEASGDMIDNLASTIRFSGGGLACVTQTLSGFGHYLVVEVSGSEGAIRATWSANDAASTEPVFDLFVGPVGMTAPEKINLEGKSGEVFELAEQIRLTVEKFDHGQPLIDVREGRKAVVVCLEAERSVVERREIALKFT